MKLTRYVSTKIADLPRRNLWVVIMCMTQLAACQTSQQRPLEYLPAGENDYRRAESVENHVLVIQTCLRSKRIDVKTLDVQLPNDQIPLTVCQDRQSRGLPCPANWEKSDPAGSLLPNSTLAVPVWVSSGSPQDIVGKWISTGNVIHGKVNSAGSAGSYLKTKTTENQPVFEYDMEDPKSLFAWSVSLNVVRNGAAKHATFWFRPPKDVHLNEFTKWRSADVEEPEGMSMSYSVAMANNANFPQEAVGSDSPFVRFGLFTRRNYKDGNRLYQHSSRHAYLNAVKVFDRSGDKVQVLYFGKNEVPPC